MNTEHTEHTEIAKLIGDLQRAERERDSLRAQLAAVTAERDALAALRPRDPHRTGHRCACCGREGASGADDVCPWCSDGLATMRERDVARAQQAPLVACVDALRAAATAAGWRDADASGETLVAWVRRGERERCDDALDSLERHYRATERDVKAHVEERGAAWERGAAIENARDAIRALPLDAPGGAS